MCRFNMPEVDGVRQRNIRTRLEELPSMDEVLGKLKSGKAGGKFRHPT